MNEIVVLTPQKLHEIVAGAVADGVRSAMKDMAKGAPNEMTDAQAAEYLAVSPQTLRCWRSEKKGPTYHKNGRSVRYSKKDLDTWLSRNKMLTIDSPEVCREKFY